MLQRRLYLFAEFKRRVRGLTQKELARRTKIYAPEISRLENGEHVPERVKTAIARFFGCLPGAG